MAVIGFKKEFQRIVADGKKWDNVGKYREIRGILNIAIDPKVTVNQRISDLDKAILNKDGFVEFETMISILTPVDQSQCNGRLLLDVVNRGNRIVLRDFNQSPRFLVEKGTPKDYLPDMGNGYLMRNGYTIASCGWQVDTPDYPALIKILRSHTIAGIKGRVYVQMQSPYDINTFKISDKDHLAYPAVDMEEKQAILQVRNMPDEPAVTLPRDNWRFGRLDNNSDYIPDPHYICSDTGFKKGQLYQLTYTTQNPPILGLSFAAIRDCVSWFKFGSGNVVLPIEPVTRAYAYGRSQTGRLLRAYVYYDFNQDEQSREVLDGIIANVAGGMRGEFNQRFGQNSKDRNNMMAQLFPFCSTSQTDIQTKETDSLHRRLDDRRSSLKVVYTNSSFEYHRGDASLIHTDPDGTRDVKIGSNVRIYHFTGTEHGFGPWPPSDTVETVEGKTRAQNLRTVIDYAPLLRACLYNLDKWVTEETPPPPSKYPRIDKGTAVRPLELKVFFTKIPGANYPQRHALPRRLDFGLHTKPEYTQILPPNVGNHYGTLVPNIDADGNEISGITLPEISVPLATHTGWTLRHPDIGGEEQLLMWCGGTIPFPKNSELRIARNDPRLSIFERYSSKDEYLSRIYKAAENLYSDGYLLKEDIDVCLKQAEKFWKYWIEY